MLEDLIITPGYKVVFNREGHGLGGILLCRAAGGSLIVYFNETHGAYKHLFSVLDKIELRQ